MAEKSKLSMSNSAETNEMGSRKTSVITDQVNRAHFSGEKQSGSGSSFVVDIESFPTQSSDQEHKTPTSINIRSFSRKGSVRGGQKMTNSSRKAIESPRGSSYGTKTPMALVAVENHVVSDHQHRVTIKAIDSETRLQPRRLNSGIIGRPYQSAFAIDPRKFLFVFATLSSLGSLVLIYCTLAIKKMDEEAGAVDWQ